MGWRKKVKVIPEDIRAEIDVTPEWWNAQFRKLQGLPAEVTWGRRVEERMSNISWNDTPYHFFQLLDPKPPTLAEIWTPTEGVSYNLSEDLADMMSAIEEAKTNGR